MIIKKKKTNHYIRKVKIKLYKIKIKEAEVTSV